MQQVKMAFSENRTRKIRRWRISVTAPAAACYNKMISCKRFVTHTGIMPFKGKKKNIHLCLIARGSCTFVAVTHNFFRCSHFIVIFIKVVIVFLLDDCRVVDAVIVNFSMNTEKEEKRTFKSVLRMIHRLQHEKKVIWLHESRIYGVLLRFKMKKKSV